MSTQCEGARSQQVARPTKSSGMMWHVAAMPDERKRGDHQEDPKRHSEKPGCVWPGTMALRDRPKVKHRNSSIL